MAEPVQLAGVRERILGTPEGQRVYAILDGASAQGLPQAIYRYGVESVCLLRGELDPDLEQVAPYLVGLDTDAPFTDWILDQGWGKHWGIFVQSAADLRAMRQHFRALLYVYDPENIPLFFRYYDPRVLRVYLPTCNSDELATLFGPVDRYLMEAEDGETLLRCELANGALVCR